MILITGYKGFIGKRLCQKLDELDIDYIGYDLVYGDDIRNRMKLDKLFEKHNFTSVIHLAALAGVRRSEEYPQEYISTNIEGTKNIVDMCSKYKSKLIFYSSSSVLGGNKTNVGLKETDEYAPKGLYAITKVTGELLVKSSNINYIIVRPFTVYGENGRSDMVIYKWINQIKAGKPITFYGDGDTKRGYTYVNDMVDGTIKLLDKLETKSFKEIIHLGGSEIVELDKLFSMFVNEYGPILRDRLPLPNADVESSYADISKAKEIIEFEPEKRFYKIVSDILETELKN